MAKVLTPEHSAGNIDALYERLSFGMVLRLFSELKPHWRDYAAVCGFGLVVAFLEMIPPKLVGGAVDQMSRGDFALLPILRVAAYWMLIAIVTQYLHGRQIKRANRAGEQVLAALRMKLFVHLQRLSMSYFDRTHAGRIIARVANDIESLRNVLIWGLNTLVANAAIMVFAGIMVLRIDSDLFFAVAWLVPVMTILSNLYGRHCGRTWQLVRQYSTLVSATQAENISGVRVVAAYNRQKQNLERYEELNGYNTHNNVVASKLNGTYQPVLQLVRFLGLAIILLLGGYKVATGRLGAGDLVAASLYWEWFMQPAVAFAALLNDLMMAMAGAERIFNLLDERPDVKDAPDARPLPTLQGNVRFEGVGFSYDGKRRVLRDVSFAVPAGSTVALVGQTGSGKSTIISLLARFYEPQAGRILIDGHELAKATNESLHRQMAMVLQANYLFSGTVLDNLRYGKPDASQHDIVQAAKALGCHERFMRLARGYETEVGERGASLSLGERQLICFTRAMIADPRILLLDEATSAMDTETERQLQAALGTLVANRTTFVIAHRLSTIVSADLILVLEQGEIIESGSHAELVVRGGKYAQLYEHSRSVLSVVPTRHAEMN